MKQTMQLQNLFFYTKNNLQLMSSVHDCWYRQSRNSNSAIKAPNFERLWTMKLMKLGK